MSYTQNAVKSVFERILSAIEYLITNGSDADGDSNDVTFYAPQSIAQGSTPALLSLGTAGAGLQRGLHKIKGTMTGSPGTVQFFSADDATGTNSVALTGAYYLGAGGGLPEEWNPDPRGVIRCAAGKYLIMTTTGGGFNGHIILGDGAAL